MESNTSDTDTEIDPDEIEITIAILKALNLVDQMNGSISDFEDVLQFAKELYCRNDSVRTDARMLVRSHDCQIFSA